MNLLPAMNTDVVPDERMFHITVEYGFRRAALVLQASHLSHEVHALSDDKIRLSRETKLQAWCYHA